MPDPAPATPPPPPPRRPRSLVNREHLDELASARKVAAAAVNPANAPGLADVEMDDTLPGQITTLAARIDGDIAKLTGARAGKGEMTAQEKIARDALIGVIAPIQTAAKRKFSGEQSGMRDAYYIGETLNTDTLDEVLTAARSIRARLVPGENNAPPLDVLPGIKAEPQIKELKDAIIEYGGKDEAQGEQQRKASGTLEEIEAEIATLGGLRRQIQLAADQAWPWRKKGVATRRKSFLLPPERPFTD